MVELTPLDGWSEDVEELELEELEEVDVVELVPVELLAVADMPGIVAALTTASTPTLAKAPTATPAVRRLRVCIAASRALSGAFASFVIG